MWPFDFAQTVTLIGMLTTSIVSIITAIRVDKVHTLVNQAATDQNAKIIMLEKSLALKTEELAVEVRKTLVADNKQCTSTTQFNRQHHR